MTGRALILAALAGVLQSGCGLEAPPTRPEPAPSEAPARSGVTVSADGYFGALVRP